MHALLEAKTGFQRTPVGVLLVDDAGVVADYGHAAIYYLPQPCRIFRLSLTASRQFGGVRAAVLPDPDFRHRANRVAACLATILGLVHQSATAASAHLCA
ncbi:hypothetical protein Aca07nite_35040 [Actinoplanes capillaceus]|uniref:Uncharacterized protein n=1 Tax=Actinoplanes campanulatus TaxID=113559 RepID=A0ABQ3WJ20_9ACTN|nr:hypothetical protein Aca07nite_35040 [Actinoplanes capillaceus]